MSNNREAYNQSETVEERLAKRRLVRKKRLLFKKSPDDQSNLRAISDHPTTESLDNKSSGSTHKLNNGLTIQNKLLPPSIIKSSELPPISNSSSKQNHVSFNNQTLSTFTPPKESKSHSLHTQKDVSTSTKPLSINDQLNGTSNVNNNAVTRVTLPIISSITNSGEKSNSSMTPVENVQNHQPHSSNDRRQSQSYTYGNRQEIDNHVLSFDSRPILRAASEQTLPTIKLEHESNNAKPSQISTLALTYLFTQRMIEAGINPSKPLKQKQSKQRTVWD